MTTTLPPLLADQLPPGLSHLQHITGGFSTELQQFGYVPVTTPLIEHADLFLIKAGDAAINRLVTFELAGETLCLRPEFTAPAARVYIEHFQNQSGPVRLQFIGPILQYENLRHGEITQRQAMGAELINEHSPAADAEIIGLTGTLLEQAGVSAWSLMVGHSGLVNRFLDRYALNRQMRRFVLEALPTLRLGQTGLDKITALLDELSLGMSPTDQQGIPISADSEVALQALMNATPQRGPSGGRSREEIARRLLEKQTHADQRNIVLQAIKELSQIIEHATTPADLHDYLRGDALEPLAASIVETFKLLGAYGIPEETVTFDLTFTRNLDYYTGIVFEYRTPEAAGNRLLGGGGRYDELIGLLGAEQHVPSVGFMLYADAIQAETAATQTAASTLLQPVMIGAQEPALYAAAIQLANQLRSVGLVVTTNLTEQLTSSPDTATITLQADGTVLVFRPLSDESTVVSSANAQDLLALLEKS